MNIYVSEFLGTALTMFLVGCFWAWGTSKSQNEDRAQDWEKINFILRISTPIATVISCLAFRNSTTYFNSALTVALAIEGTLSWKVAALYIAAQAAGFLATSMLLSLCFWKLYRKAYPAGAAVILNGNVGGKDFSWHKEIGLTFLLVFLIKLIGRLPVEDIIQIILFGVVNLFLAIKYKAYEYYCLNPLRDLIPRLFRKCLPSYKVGYTWWDNCKAAWFGPFIGAIAAAWFYGLIFLVF